MLPLQVLAPVALDDPAAIVSILNPTGGLVGGDRLDITIDVGEGAHACLTTPSATKVYRTIGAMAEQHARVTVAAGATCEWVPEHTIPFPASALRQTFVAEIATDAKLIVVDGFAAGRIARDERWQFQYLESTVSIRDPAGWLFHDRFVLHGGWRDGCGLTENQPYFATMIVIGAGDTAAFIREATEAGHRSEAKVAAAPLPHRGVGVRVLARHAPGFISTLETVWMLGRQILLSAPALTLRKS